MNFINRMSQRIDFWWNRSLFPIEGHRQIAVHQAWTPRQEIWAAVALAIACLVVLLPSLSCPLIDPDETRYAQIALEMNATGDWITPKLDKQAYLDKPPLMYWLTAVSFYLLGNHETAARLPSVLSALATIGLVFALGRRLVGSRAAWLGAMMLLLSGGFVLAGRFLILDSLLTLFVVAALLAGYIAVRDLDHHWKWWMVAGVACALGVLTKGPVALVLSVPPLAVSGWLRRDQTQIGIRHWIAFGLPTLVLCLPWYLAVWKSNPEFGDTFFWEHNLKRFTQGSNHEQPFWFYLPVLFAGMFPASLLLPALAMFLFSRSDRERNHRSKDLGYLACGTAWILTFFSLASCKLPTYILPALPLICLMLGDMLERTVLNPSIPSRITTYLKPFPQRANLILVFACLTVLGVQGWFCGELGIAGRWAAGATVLVLIGTTMTWNRSIAFSSIGWTTTLVVAVAMVSFAATSFLPAMATERSLYGKTANIAQQYPDAQIVFFGEHAHAANFQLPSNRITYFDKQQGESFAALIAAHPRAIVVTDEEDIQATRDRLSASHRLLAQPAHQHLYLAEPHHAGSPHVAAANHGGLR